MATTTKTTTVRLRPKDRARLDAMIEWDRRQTGLRASASTVVRSLLFGFVDELIERGEIDDKLLRTRAAAYRGPAADSLRRDRRERREWQNRHKNDREAA